MKNSLFMVRKIDKNTISYEEVEGGWWAYIKEIPTTRCFGEEKVIAFSRLIILIENLENQNG